MGSFAIFRFSITKGLAKQIWAKTTYPDIFHRSYSSGMICVLEYSCTQITFKCACLREINFLNKLREHLLSPGRVCVLIFRFRFIYLFRITKRHFLLQAYLFMLGAS